MRPALSPRHRLARLGYRMMYVSYRIASVLARPRLRGALALVRVGSRILLVRNSYNSWFTLPGGRVDRGESFVSGAARELREETGVRVPEAGFTRVHAATHQWQHRTERIEIHATRLDLQPSVTLDPVEIAEARWLTVDQALALDLYPPLRDCLTRHGTGSAAPPGDQDG